jgi:OmpA-OmpF porin, OOP family
MAISLVDDLTGQFKSQALGEAAAKLGESEGSVLRGLQTASATILGGLASKIGQSGVMKQAFDLANSTFSDSKVFENVRGLFSGNAASDGGNNAGTKLLAMLFGGSQWKITDKISQAAGIRPSSATTLMSVAAPVVLGVLGKHVQEEHLDPAGFSSLLQRESSGIRGLLPPALSNLLGLSSPAVLQAPKTISPGRPAYWIWPLVGLVVLMLALVWIASRNLGQVAGVAQGAATQVRTAAAGLGDFFKTNLADGVDLNIPRNGIEARLLDFIKDPTRPVDAATWFEFDRLSFDANSSNLRADSQEQLFNIAAILKAYPNVHIRIGGYTDNTGDAAANLQLSQARANSVQEQLITMGINPDRLEAKGYGEGNPIADNSTDEGRARNRRISLRVTQK